MTNAIDWNAQLAKLQEECFLVGPVTDLTNTTLPDGFDLAVTRVKLDVGADTYKVGTTGYGDDKVEEHALSKSGIERLATAAGAQCVVRRVDDRSHPHRCEFEAQAVMRMLDGSQQFSSASRGYDLAEEGSDYLEVGEKAYQKAFRDNDYAKGQKLAGDALEEHARMKAREAVMQARGTMSRNAETKAKLRALRTLLGIRSKYPVTELKRKHFAVLRAHFSGRSSDPALRQQLALMAAESALGASRALFGPSAGAAPMRALPTAAESPRALRELPPPNDYEPPDDEVIDAATGETTTVSDSSAQGKAATPSPSSGAAAPTAPASPASERPATSFACKVSEKYPVEALRGKCYADLTDEQLSSYVDWAVNRANVEGPTWTQKGRDGAKKAIDAAYADVDWRMGQKGSGPQGNGGEW